MPRMEIVQREISKWENCLEGKGSKREGRSFIQRGKSMAALSVGRGDRRGKYVLDSPVVIHLRGRSVITCLITRTEKKRIRNDTIICSGPT